MQPLLFAGSSNIPLARKIARRLNIRVGKKEVAYFSNSEQKVTIDENVDSRICLIVQSLSNPTDKNIIQLLLIADALKREGASKLIGIIPYFGYARQNRQYRKGECISAKVIIKLIEKLKFDSIITLDLHDKKLASYFKIPCINIECGEILAENVRNLLETKKTLGSDSIDPKNIAIVAPDSGSVDRVRIFGEMFFRTKSFPVYYIHKIRDKFKPGKIKSYGISGIIRQEIVLIVDDIVASGSTLINASRICKRNGARKIIAAISHCDFMPSSASVLDKSLFSIIASSDSIDLKKSLKPSNLIVLSADQIIANKLKSIL